MRSSSIKCRAIIYAVLIASICVNTSNAFSDEEFLKYRGAVGFADRSDKIVDHEFTKDGKKLILIGEKNLQIWNVDSLKLIRSIPNSIDQFTPSSGFFSKYILLGLPKLLQWRPYLIDPNGKWIATIEKEPTAKGRLVIVRDLKNLDQIGTLSVDEFSAKWLSFDEQKNEILTTFEKGKANAFVSWKASDLSKTESIVIDEYKWHEKIQNGKKVIVGAGDSKFVLNLKQGETLSLRDVATGETEKYFTADNLDPKTPFQDTEVTDDEKILISKRDDRLFVWDIDGDGKPRFEIPGGDLGYKFKKILNDRFILASKEKDLYLFDIRGNGMPNMRFQALAPKDSVKFADISADGRFIALEEDERVRVFDLNGGGEPVLELRRDSPNERFRGIVFLNEFGSLAVGRANNADKKEFRSEIYDLTDFKLTKTYPRSFQPGYELILNDKYMFDESTGSASIWDPESGKAVFIPIKTETNSCSYDDTNCTETTSNAQRLYFNNDETRLIRTGDNSDSLWDVKSGERLQELFDKDKVKCNKRNEVKHSGLAETKWSADNSYVYALDMSGLFRTSRLIHFWDVVK